MGSKNRLLRALINRGADQCDLIGGQRLGGRTHGRAIGAGSFAFAFALARSLAIRGCSWRTNGTTRAPSAARWHSGLFVHAGYSQDQFAFLAFGRDDDNAV